LISFALKNWPIYYLEFFDDLKKVVESDLAFHALSSRYLSRHGLHFVDRADAVSFYFVDQFSFAVAERYWCLAYFSCQSWL
jgi:hypothetical protein